MKDGLLLPPEHPRSLVYFGSPEAAVPPLLALVEAGFEIPLVVSMPDRRRGRRTPPEATAVKEPQHNWEYRYRKKLMTP